MGKIIGNPAVGGADKPCGCRAFEASHERGVCGLPEAVIKRARAILLKFVACWKRATSWQLYS